MDRIYYRFLEGLFLLCMYASLIMIWIGILIVERRIHMNANGLEVYWGIGVSIIAFLVSIISFVVMIINDSRHHKQDTYRFDALDKGDDRLSGEHDRLSGEHNRLSGEHDKLSGEHDKLSGEHDKLSGEHDKLREQLNKIYENHNQLLKRNAELEMEVKQLKLQILQMELNPEYTDDLDIEENGFGIDDALSEDDDFEIE